MRILIVSQYFWPEGFRINDLVKSLIEKGIEVDVLTGKHDIVLVFVNPKANAEDKLYMFSRLVLGN